MTLALPPWEEAENWSAQEPAHKPWQDLGIFIETKSHQITEGSELLGQGRFGMASQDM